MPTRSLARKAFCSAILVALTFAVAFGLGGPPAQQAKLTASDAANADYFGDAVAVSSDTAIVGAAQDGSTEGVAYIFTRSGDVWTQEQRIVASDFAIADAFGVSVAIGGDTAAVGASANNSSPGAAYVFTRMGTVWTEQQKLTALDAEDGDNFGFSVAFGVDTVIVGAPGKGFNEGTAYVFTRSGTTWTQEAQLTSSDSANADLFGSSVALSGDTAVVGARGKSSGKGAAYVFTRSGTTWTEQSKLTALDGANSDAFGQAVSVSADTALVGADKNSVERGAAYVFTRAGTTWTQEAKLTAADGVGGDRLGNSVVLVGDTAVAGAFRKNTNQGAAYTFTRSGTTWTEQDKLTPADPGSNDEFGNSVGLAGDTVIVGAPEKNTQQGAAYVFDLTGGSVTPSAGYCLPTKVKAKVNLAQPAKSTLTASGYLDTGTGVPDFSGAATFDIGGFHLDIPAFVPKGSSLSYSAGGITLKITPSKTGSSRATFSVKVVGDLTGNVSLDGPLAFNFTNTTSNLNGTATLTAGALGLLGVTARDLYVLKAAATLKGGGQDALQLTLGFASDGTVPGTAEDLTISFGETFEAAILAANFAAKGGTYVLATKTLGITKATVDYIKGTITIAGAGLDLGAFAQGGNGVVITITRGGDTRTVEIRMSLTATKLAY